MLGGIGGGSGQKVGQDREGSTFHHLKFDLMVQALFFLILFV